MTVQKRSGKLYQVMDFISGGVNSFFNWNIIALQYHLCCTMKWINYMYTNSPSFMDLSPTPTPTHPPMSAQSMELNSLGCTSGSHQPSILNMVVEPRFEPDRLGFRASVLNSCFGRLPACLPLSTLSTPRFPRWFSGRESVCQCRRHGFDLWIWRKNGTHSGLPAWEMPYTEEPGHLQSVGSQTSSTGFSKQTAPIAKKTLGNELNNSAHTSFSSLPSLFFRYECLWRHQLFNKSQQHERKWTGRN